MDSFEVITCQTDCHIIDAIVIVVNIDKGVIISSIVNAIIVIRMYYEIDYHFHHCHFQNQPSLVNHHSHLSFTNFVGFIIDYSFTIKVTQRMLGNLHQS